MSHPTTPKESPIKAPNKPPGSDFGDVNLNLEDTSRPQQQQLGLPQHKVPKSPPPRKSPTPRTSPSKQNSLSLSTSNSFPNKTVPPPPTATSPLRKSPARVPPASVPITTSNGTSTTPVKKVPSRPPTPKSTAASGTFGPNIKTPESSLVASPSMPRLEGDNSSPIKQAKMPPPPAAAVIPTSGNLEKSNSRTTTPLKTGKIVPPPPSATSQSSGTFSKSPQKAPLPATSSRQSANTSTAPRTPPASAPPPPPKLINPKILPPAPSFEKERLALLKHLKETPKQVSHSTETEDADLRTSQLKMGEHQDDNVMSSTLTLNAENSSASERQKRDIHQQQQQNEDPYASALNAALQATHEQLLVGTSETKKPSATNNSVTAILPTTNNNNNNINLNYRSVSGNGSELSSVANQQQQFLQQQQLITSLQVKNSQLKSYLFLRDLEYEEMTYRSQISNHAVEFIDELRNDFWKSMFASTTLGTRDLAVSDTSVQSLVQALEEAQTQSAHAADRLQETYDVLDRMATELADSRSLTLQVQAELTHARETHAAVIEQMRLDFELERDAWARRSEEKFMKRVKKLASRVASQEQELIELRGAIGSLRSLSFGGVPGGSELALRIVEDALNVDIHQGNSSSYQQQNQNQQPSQSSRHPSQQQQQQVGSSRTGSQQQQQQATIAEPSPPSKYFVGSGGTKRLFETGVLDAESATVKRLIEKGYLSPP
jgi:hypothetical protein